MQLKLFIVPIKNLTQAEQEMNAFLRGHRVLAVKKEFVPDGENSFWTFCVEHLEVGAGAAVAGEGRAAKVDYRDILNEADFSKEGGRLAHLPMGEESACALALSSHFSLANAGETPALLGGRLALLPMASERTAAKHVTLSHSIGECGRGRPRSLGTAKLPVPALLAPLFRLLLISLSLLGVATLSAQDPLVVPFDSPVFTLDLRITSENPVETGLVVQMESPSFQIDTRTTSQNPTETGLVTQVESAAFTLDTRISGIVPAEGFTVLAESAAFTIDTRLTSVPASEGAVTVVESAAFTIDTRIIIHDPAGDSLITQSESVVFTLDTRVTGVTPIETDLLMCAESEVFTIDTRITFDNPESDSLVTRAESTSFVIDLRVTSKDIDDSALVTRFESNTFTLDTQSGWIKMPFRDLAGSGAAGGKLRFSPDGMRLAKADGGRVLLWDLQSPKPGVAMASGGGELASVEFLPPGDQILTGHAGGTVRWWDAVTREEAGRVTPGTSGTAYAASSADGARILAGRGTSLGLFRATDKALIQELEGLAAPITALALSPDGLLALAATSDRVVTVWATANAEILHRLTGHTHLITAAAFLPDGAHAFTASLDGTIRIWELGAGDNAFVISQGGQVADAALSSDGSLIASCNTANPGTAYLWDARDGALTRVFTDASSDPSPMKGVAISPDHTMLVTSHADGRARVWDTALTPQPTQTVTPLAVGASVPVTLRSHGLYYFEVDAAPGSSLVVTLEAVANAPRAHALLSYGETAAGTSSGISEDARFANLGEPAPAKMEMSATSIQKPPPTADITAFRMTSMRGRLPSAYDYETFAQAPVSDLHCEMPLVLSAFSKAYVLVYAPHLSAGTIAASIRVEAADFHLSDISPARGGNGGKVTARIQGTGLTPDTTARLIGAGGTTVDGQLALWGNPTKAWFTFPLAGLAPGSYQVEIAKPGAQAAVAATAFQVVTAAGPLLQASLTAPSAVRPGRDYGMTLKFANVGDVDMAAPLFVVSAGDQLPSIYSQIRIHTIAWTRASGVPNTPRVPQVQILGVNQEGPPGVLPPGANWEIPLYFQGDGSVWDMAFHLRVLKADATPIDWAELETRMKPADMAPDLWSVIWNNFKASIGSTWADWLHALDNQAHLMTLAGQTTSNAGDLLAALFSQSLGSSYRRTLAAAVDARAPAPALPLQFSRFATDGIEHRFSVGPLGRGWSHNYEYALTRPATGEVLIETPGGGARRFTLGPDNLWHGATRDHATLAASASGGFTLTEPQGLSWHFSATGKLVSIAEPNGNRITLSYTAGRLTDLVHSAGPAFILEYDDKDRLFRLTDHAGQVTTYQYDASGEHLLGVTAPGGIAAAYTYHSAPGAAADHAIESVTFPDLTHQYFAWDSRGRVAEQSRDDGTERLRFTYDASGTVTIRDAQDAVTTLRLGTNGQLLQMVDALGRPVTFGYDAKSNLTRLTGPVGETTELSYDAKGNAREIVNPLGQTVTMNHQALGRLGSLSDALGQGTDFEYDPQGNLTGIAYADDSEEAFDYDTAGNVTGWTNRRGQTVQFLRNAQGQPTRKTYPDGRTIDYEYNARGQLTKVTDSVQGVTQLGYDARGFLTGITYPDGKGFSFEYNDAGRRTRRTGTDGYILNYDYDAAGRLEILTDGNGNEMVRYGYDPAGRLERETKGNGTYTTYGYDAAGQVLEVTNHAPDDSVQSFFHYTYDAKGNRLTMTTADGVTRYGYDALNQLTGVTYPDGRRVTYEYDAAGNRKTVNDNGANTAYTANNLNQYTHAGPASFGYDADGNMTRKTDATGTTNYHYDIENRLVRVETPADGVFEYTYDALGNRTTVTHDGVATRYLHDPIGLVDVAAEYDAAGSLVARYDHGLGLVARTDGSGNEAFYSFDALGNTRELTDGSGTVVNEYDYDAFGEATVAEGTVGNAFRFVGRFGVMQEENDLDFMRARYYDVKLGRFATVDLMGFVGGGSNLYAYAANEPNSYIDPSGWSSSVPLTDIRNQKWRLVDWVSVKSHWTVGGGVGTVWDLLPLQLGQDLGEAWGPGGTWGQKLATTVGVALTLVPGLLPKNVEVKVFTSGGDLWWYETVRNIWPAILDVIDKSITAWGAWDDWLKWLSQHAHLQPISQASSTVVRPVDPNDKIAPAGIGPDHVVSRDDAMEYIVRFENFATASAPVQELIVVDYLDAALDWSTVKFKEMAYGGRIITIPEGSQTFAIQDTPPSDSPAVTGIDAAHMVVNASGSVNPQIGRIEWRLSSLDLRTNYFPIDALTGFLPPEDGTGCGNGYVKFSVKPKATTAYGTTVTNVATIVFDGSDPIDTPPVSNVIGDVPSLATVIAYLPGEIEVGVPFSYTVALANTGDTSVSNISLTDTLPDGTTFVSATATRGTVTITGGVLTWTLDEAASGEEAVLTITAVASEAGIFTNHLTFTGGSGLAIYTAASEFTVNPATGKPPLAIQRVNDTVELSWPSSATGWILESTTDLTASWTPVTAAPVIVGDRKLVTESLVGPHRFYRLRKP